MKLTTLTAILVLGLFSVSASLAGDSTYLEERSARLHQGVADTSEQMMGSERIHSQEPRQTYQGPTLEQERWWK
ncbi:MAG: hypothetical protein R3215_13810 [Halomonas sp.]|nr:hypothetical protein [Halomonas sp.]